MMTTSQDDSHNTMDCHPMHWKQPLLSTSIECEITYTCDNDVRSLNDPSGIDEMSFPCKDLHRWIRFYVEFEIIKQNTYKIRKFFNPLNVSASKHWILL